MNWLDLRYLQGGNPRQQRAYAVLQELRIWNILHEFDPVLTGTIPLAIDTAESDLDVICTVAPAAQATFKQLLEIHFGQWPAFYLTQTTIGAHDSIVSSFRYQEAVIEVFGQAVPTLQQHAYRHLVVEHAVLQAGGEAWRTAVQCLKQQGLKTEPAFARLLHLPGNPYEAVLTLEGKTAAELTSLLARCPLPTPAQARPREQD